MSPATLTPRRRGAAPWTPLELSPLVWLKQGALVYSDAGTTPAVDTDPVYQWGDSSGNGFNANQTTLGNRPLYVANSGNPYLDFDGTDDYLDLGQTGLSTPLGLSVYVRFNPDSVAGNNFLVCKDDNALGRSYSIAMLGSKLYMELNGTSTPFDYAAGFTTGTEYRICITGNAANDWAAYIDGVEVATAAWVSPNANTAPTNVGRRSYSGFENYSNGKMRDVLIFNVGLSAADVALLDAYHAP